MPEYIHTHPNSLVLELLAARITSGSKPDQRTDQRKLGLVIEGGAMRGAVSGGMVSGIEAILKGTIPFDAMYLSSAGSCAGLYLAAEQTRTGVSIYYDCLNDRKFINLRNIFRGRPVINTPYLMDIMWNEDSPKQLDVAKVLDYPIPLHIYGTDARTGEGYDFYPYEDSEDLKKSVESTIKVPVYSGDPVQHRESYYLDSGLSVGRVPIWKAVEDGCTDLLVLWTSKRKLKNYRYPISERPIPYVLRRRYPVLAANYWQGHDRHKDTIRFIEQAQTESLNAPNIEVIKVSDGTDVPGSSETNSTKLYLGAVAGRDAVVRRLGNIGLVPSPDSDLFPPA